MTRWVVVGAGLTGATIAERIARVRGEEVVVVERKPYVGGTASDYVTPEGLLVQRHGPHVFHTNSAKVWQYMLRFATWRPTVYKVVADVEGMYVPLPVGFTGIDRLFPEQAERMKAALTARFGLGGRVPITTLLREEDPDIQELARGVYESIFHNYTKRHWGLEPSELQPSVTARVPIVVGDQESYHASKHQGVPEGGYTALVQAMLTHPRIRVELGKDFRAGMASNVIYTGAIDEYFGYGAGRLPYRSVHFDLHTDDGSIPFLPAATVTHPNGKAFTRVTEMRQITGQQHALTALVYEYPLPCKNGLDPLYPIPTDANRRLHDQYRQIAKLTSVKFCGRLGEYLYLNMDQAVASAMKLVEQLP